MLGDYKSNVALYPAFQDYFRTHKPHLLAAWGKNDPFFLPADAEAFRRDIPAAVIHFFDTGHFALETHAKEIAEVIRDLVAQYTLRPTYYSEQPPPLPQMSAKNSFLLAQVFNNGQLALINPWRQRPAWTIVPRPATSCGRPASRIARYNPESCRQKEATRSGRRR